MKDVETVEIGETSDEKESSSEEVTQEKESKEKNSKASFIKELLVYAVIIILCVQKEVRGITTVLQWDVLKMYGVNMKATQRTQF